MWFIANMVDLFIYNWSNLQITNYFSYYFVLIENIVITTIQAIKTFDCNVLSIAKIYGPIELYELILLFLNNFIVKNMNALSKLYIINRLDKLSILMCQILDTLIIEKIKILLIITTLIFI